MMIKDAIRYIVELGNKKEVELNGTFFSNNDLQVIQQPRTNSLGVNTLTGLIEYAKSKIDIDNINDNYMIHIVSPTRVKLISKITGNDAQRTTLVIAQPLLPEIYFNRYTRAEEFNIMLQSSFVKNEDRDLLLKFSGNIQENTSRKTQDDGVTQVVEMKTGVTTISNVIVPNPVTLAPYRSFTEIEQVESEFIFRVKDGPQCAIYEADGGAWRNEAMKRIKEYLRKELGDEITILA